MNRKQTHRAVADIREIPTYTVREAALYLRIPMATLRSWVLGRAYPTSEGRGFFKPVIAIPSAKPPLLSFMNLVEAHVLAATRRQHQLPLDNVRRALHYLQKEYPSRHPLADQNFETDGLDLFIEQYGRLINISQEGQLAIKDLLKAYLRRIERAADGLPIKLYPFTRKGQTEEPKAVVIDPLVSFGRPVLSGTGIATSMIAERYKAGESIQELAEDYGRQTNEIEEAIRYELQLQEAA